MNEMNKRTDAASLVAGSLLIAAGVCFCSPSFTSQTSVR